MDNKIKDTEKIETKNLESIPGENDLPDVKSKEYYENLVTERRMNSYEMRKKAREAASDESIQEVNAEDLDGVAGGKGDFRRPWWWKPTPIPRDAHLNKYAGPPPKLLTLEELKKIKEEERKRKELEEKTKQELSIGVDQDRSTR